MGLGGVGVAASVSAVPGPDEEAAARAAAEIQATRDEANAAAAEFFAAQSELEQLADQAVELEAEHVRLVQTADALRSQVEEAAVNRFLSSGSASIPLLTDYRQPAEQLQVGVLMNVVTNSSADVMDEYERVSGELEANRQAVADNQAAVEEQQAEARSLQEFAESEVVRLEAVEAQRLEDEQVHLALLAIQREEQRRREEEAARQAAEEAARRAAEEAARVAAEEAARQAAEEAARQAAAAAQAAEEARAASDAEAAAAAERAAREAQAAADAAAAAVRANDSTGSSDSSASADPGASPSEGSPPDPAPSSGGMICPVAGSSSYADGWGNPRSGGRRHQGVDMMARRGTPLVAVVSGSVQFKHNSLGGNAVWLRGDDGHAYYYAHLSAYEGSSRGVAQGEVIGYVGDTGNATGVNHLHFEVHPGGGAAVNPYPYVVDAGC